jgi:hypothetical protein
VSALRLARLHGQGAGGGVSHHEALRASERWQRTHAMLERARDARPELRLEGDA